MYRLSAFALLLLLSSCATIVNRPTYTARVDSNAPNAKVIIADSTYTLPAKVKIKRSKDNLNIQLVSDTLTRSYTLVPRTQAGTVAGNFALFGGFGFIGMYVDKKNLKSQYYGRSIFLDVNNNNTLLDPRVIPPGYYAAGIPKGTVNLVGSVPYINTLYLQHPDFGSLSGTGFLGLSLGIEYYFEHNRSLRLMTGGLMDFMMPIPVPIDYDEDEREMMSSFFVSLTTNWQLNRFSFGFGPSWTVNTLIRTDRRTWAEDNDYYHDEHITRAMGLSLNGYFRLTPSFHMGLLYNPNLLNVSPDMEFGYSHTLSIDLQWRLSL